MDIDELVSDGVVYREDVDGLKGWVLGEHGVEQFVE